MPDLSPAPKRHLYWAVAATACLAIAGGGAFYYATLKNAEAARGQKADRTVTISATACEPNAITVPGGKRSFEIVNTSDRPIEWEIVSGVLVLAERENIAPGIRAALTVQLTPGTYEMTCGLLSNPRGTLTVTPSDEATAAASDVTLRKFLGPLSEYRVYLVMQGSAAQDAVQVLRDAIAAGDVAAAMQAWKDARLPYRRIEPLAYRLSDLENTIDPRAAYLAGRESDPAFSGFHRIEYGLFSQNSTEGLLPVADKLLSDMGVLQDRLADIKLDPALLIALPGDMATQLAQSHIPQGDNLYAGNDLEDLSASLDGIEKLTGLLRSVVAPVNPALDTEIGTDTSRTRADLDALKSGDSFPPYAQVTAEQRKKLSDDLMTLAASLSKLQKEIGLD